ncbi:MAG: hypothetical protein HZB82_00535 [Deltaproteobacteria bacterium]|nr:hypothetical protein [Deltaproteobacteria bacterium]
MPKGLLLLIIAMFLFVSCSDGTKKEEPKAAAPGAREVVDKYVDTLTAAKPKAEKAAEAENKRVEEQDRMLKELEK